MITQVLTSRNVGKEIYYSKRDHKEELKEIPKSDDFTIVRKFETQEVSKSFGERIIKVQQKIYPPIEEKIYKDGKEVELDYRRNDIDIKTKVITGFGTPCGGLFETYKSLPNELKELYNDNDFMEHCLIVVNYLASSGSNSVLTPNAFTKENVLNITVPVKIPAVGTCDMKSHKICILISKNKIEECKEYIVRFIEED